MHQGWTRRFTVVIACLAMGCVYLPLLPGVGRLLWNGLPAAPWNALFTDNQLPAALLATLISTLISTLLALFICLLLVVTLWPFAPWKWLQQRLPVLLALPHVAFASGCLLLFAPSGWLSRLIINISIFDGPTVFIDRWGIGLGLVLAVKESWFLLWVCHARLSESELTPRLNIAATLGYGPLQSRMFIVIPWLVPRLGSALLAALAYSLSVVDVALIIGPGNPPTFAALAWSWLNDSDPALQQKGEAASVLLMVLLAGLAAAGFGLWRIACRQFCPRNGQRRAVSGQGVGIAMGGLLPLLGFMSVLILLAWSLAQSWFAPALLPAGLSTEAWRSASLLPLLNTGWLALASSMVGLVVVLLWLETFGCRWQSLFWLPLCLPALPLVMAQYPILLWLGWDGSFWGVVWSHLLWVIPYMMLILMPAWQHLDPRLIITARTFGWSQLQVFWRVKWPLLMRAILSAVAVGFSVSIAQYLPTLFNGAGRWSTVTTEAVALSSGGDPQALAIQSLLQLLLPAGAFFIATLLGWLSAIRHQGLR